MAGLTNPMVTNAPAPQGAPPSPQPMPPGAPPPQGTPAPAPGQPQAPKQPSGPPLTTGPVDPELAKKMIANCMNVVTGSLQGIVKTVSQAQDKVAALAQAAVLVVIRVEDSLEQSGGKLNLSMTFEAGAETITDISDAMQKAGVYTYKQQEIDAAFLRAVDQYRMIRQQQGRLDPAQFQQIVQQMKQAQQDGTLDQKYPGLTQFAQQAQRAAKPSYAPQGQADGDGQDQEDDGDEGAPPAPAAAPSPKAKKPPAKKPANAAMPEPGQNFPPAMLKPKKGQLVVKAHIRRAPGSNANPKKGGI